jgi:hypothetical protein
MKNFQFLPALFNVQLSFIIIGAILKILHLPLSDIILGIGICACLVFTILALMEIYSSPKLSSMRKSKWLFAFLFVNTIAGLYYISYSRNTIVDNYSKI